MGTLISSFRPLLGLFFIESSCVSTFSISSVSVPYWGFFLLNERVHWQRVIWWREFPSPIGAFFYWMRLLKQVRMQQVLVSVPYWGFFLLNVNFTNASDNEIVSVPYWGFFLLNELYQRVETLEDSVSVPYWGFFLLNHRQNQQQHCIN